MLTDDDVQLVSRVAAGDRAALAALYDRYASQLLAVGIRIVKGRAAAEDVMHDVFLEVWKRAGDYDPQRGTVRAWLAMRMRSRCLDRQKSPRVARSVSLDATDFEQHAAPAVDPGLRMERERVRAAVATLTPEQRELMELAYFSGLSVNEIGERLHIPSGTVKSRMSSAREKLRALLTETPTQGRAV